MKAPDLWEKFHFRGKDIRGTRYTRLVVVDLARIHRSPTGATIAYWKCRCDCGTEIDVAYSALACGHTKSCKCLHKVAAGQRVFKHGMSSKTNVHPIYRVWAAMLSRCENPNHADYHNYGGRGITVCERWHSFESFRDDMLPTWQPKLSLDRRENSGNYCPDNCRWITPREQCNNTRYNRTITINGETKTVAQWAEVYQISKHTILSRLNRGLMSPQDSVTTPPFGTPQGL